MALLAYLTLALLCITAQAAPSFKALEDDVAIARQESVDLDIESLEFANELNLVDLKTDLEIRPISADIVLQLEALNIDPQEVRRIEMLFRDSFDIIQESIRRIERELSRMRVETFPIVLNALDTSDWTNLRQETDRLRNEITNVHSLYHAARADLDTNLANLDTNLNEVLVGQETADIVAVLSNWQRINDLFDAEFLTLEDEHIIWSGRASRTLSALDVVLDQV